MKRKIISFFTIVFAFLTLSCEVGLGFAPDTETPELSILKPGVNAVIRDEFLLCGDYSDDGTIESIIVTFEQTDVETEEVITFNAEINTKDNTWSCLINPLSKDKPIADGNYQVSVEITDTYKHSTVERRSYTIDNTPPIIVLQRPGTKESADSLDSYGQTFVLQGQAADDNNIDLIEVSIFDNPECTGAPIHTVSLPNVPLAIELDVAKFGEENYTKIYGEGKSGEKQFYCRIKGYDGAQRYPSDNSNQTPADLLGNSTESYYLYNDISESVLGLHKITEIYDMMNGSYVGDSSSEEINQILGELNQNKTQIGSFSLNPANNPIFKLNSIDPLTGSGNDFENEEGNPSPYNITNKTSVIVEVSPGLDNIALNKDSLKVFVTECDEVGKAIDEANKFYPESELKISGSSCQFVTKLENDTDFQIGKNYIFGVEGNDIKGNEVVPSDVNGYGFHFASSGAAPTIEITTAEIKLADGSIKDSLSSSIYYMPKGSKLHIAGTISQDAGKPGFSVYYGEDKLDYITISDEPSEGNVYSFNFTLEDEFNQGESKNNTFTIIGGDSLVQTEIRKTISYDIAPPNIEIQQVAPIASKYINEEGNTDGNQYLNGKFSFKINISDSFDVVGEDTSSWQLIQDGSIKQGDIETPAAATIEVDTTSGLADKKEVTLKIISADRAGNKSEKSQTYYIDQNTDKPVILPNDQTLTLTLDTKEKYDNQAEGKGEDYQIKNVFIVSGSINLKIIDDDGIKSVTTQYAKYENGELGEYSEEVTENIQSKPKETVFAYKLPDVAGYYKIKILVKDIYDTSTDSVEFVVKATTQAPTVFLDVQTTTITTNSENVLNPITKLNNLLTIESTESPFIITRKINDQVFGEEIKVNASEYEDVFALSSDSYVSGNYEIQYLVKDINGRTGYSQKIPFYVDNNYPTIEIVKTPTAEETEGSSLYFSGNSSEVNSTINYKLYNKDDESKILEGGITPGSVWSLNINPSEITDENGVFTKEGEKIFALQIRDSVGNLSNWIEKSFIYDKTKPSINKVSYSLDLDSESPLYTEYTGKISLAKAFKMEVDASDGYGIESITVNQTINGATSKVESLEKLPYGEQYYDENGIPLSGDYKYTIIAKDKAGKSSEKEVIFQIDTLAPVITVKAPASDLMTKDTALAGDEYNFNLGFNDGTGSGVKSVSYAFVKEGQSEINWISQDVTGSSEIWITKTLGLAESENNLSEGSWTLKAKVIDSANNESSEIERKFIVDKALPVFTLNNEWITPGVNPISFTANRNLDSDIVTINISGSARDTNGLAESNWISIYVDGVSKEVTLNDDNTWSCNINSGSEEGDLLKDLPTIVKIVVKDIIGKEFSKEYTLFLDTKAPEIEILAPVDGEQIVNDSVTIKGTVQEDGFGLEALTFVLKDKDGNIVKDESGKEINSTNYPLEVKGSSWYSVGENGMAPISLGTKEGSLTLTVTGEEKTTGLTSTVDQNFFFDKSDPIISETKIETSLTTNANFTFEGSVSDSNELAKIIFSDLYTPAGESTSSTVNMGEEVVSSGLTEYNWSKDFAIGPQENQLKDGNHIFTITVLDISGKQNYIQRTIKVDTVKPSVTTLKVDDSKIEGKEVDSKTYYNTSQIPILIVAEDNEHGVGLTRVQYSVNAGEWFDVSKNSEGYFATITCKDGSNEIKVKAEDLAGNTSEIKTLTVYVDTQAPSTCTLENNNFSVLANGIYANNEENVTISLFAEDYIDENISYASTGIQSVEFVKIGNTKLPSPISAEYDSENNKYTLEIPASTFTSTGTAVFAVTDGAGNKAEFSLFQISLDKTYPKTSISTPVDADNNTAGIQVNKIMKISGTATDDYLLNVQVQYRKEAATEWENYSTPITENIYSWSCEVDTSSLEDNTNYEFRAIATDKAGNTGNSGTSNSAELESNYITVEVNQASDIPTIRFTNISFEDSENIILKNVNSLLCLVSDDDGEINKVEYKLNNGEWTEVEVTPGSGYFEINDISDGQNTIQFRITDAVNSLFVSGDSSSPIKLYDGSSFINTNLNMRVDTKEPVLENLQYIVSENGDYSNSTASESLRILGGIYDGFKIQFNSSDDNGIKQAYASLFKTENKNTVELEGSKITVTSSEDGLYEISDFEIKDEWHSSAEVSYGLKLVIEDNCGLEKVTSLAINIDNIAPRITPRNPSTLVCEAETITGTIDTASLIYYGVTKAENQSPKEWKEVKNSTTAYSISFDGVENPENNQTYLLKDYIHLLEITSSENILNNTYTDITTLYIWIKAVDECGNESSVCIPVNVDPQGDRPTVSLSYPDSSNGDVKLGGTIRLVGTAIDNIAAKYVWIQIDCDGSEGFSKADLQYLKDNNYTIGNMNENRELDSLDEVTDANVANYGIMIPVKGSGWNLSINENGEFNSTEENETNTIKLTIFATDDDLGDSSKINKSLPVESTIIIDQGSPYFVQTSLKLIQYLSSDGSLCTDCSVNSGTIGASQSYVDGMSVKGKWFLVGEIRDDGSGIASVSQGAMELIGSSLLQATGDGKGYYFQIPIGNNAANQVGVSEIVLSAQEIKDASPISITKTFSVLYDNKAPVMTVSGSNKNINLSDSITNTNGYYTFGAIASEDNIGTVTQTGVERVAVYFTRDLDYALHSQESENTRDLFDAMIYNANDYEEDVNSSNMIPQYLKAVESNTLKFEDGLYWRKASASIEGAAISFNDTLPATVHKGRLVKVNGVIYKIDSVDSGNVITISGEPGDSDSIEVLIAVANIIDTTGEKNGQETRVSTGYGNGYYIDSSTDDGDLMIESFTKQGTDWIWDASINSRNLPDGPITVHIVAFDAAGNIATHSYEGTVRNNSPRIVGLKIGTDENGDNVVDEDKDKNEFIYTMSNLYALGYDDSGKSKVTEATFPTIINSGDSSIIRSAITIKGKTVIKPELIGGNGELKYEYSVSEKNADNTWANPYHTSEGNSLGFGGTTDKVLSLSEIVLDIPAFIGSTNNLDEKLIKDGEKQKFSFVIGDSTPSKSQDGLSQSAVMNVIMDVRLRETESASTYIQPFYWHNSSENSLFLESREKGHIELTEDVVDNSNFVNKRPYVSGAIKLEGIARDNTLIKEIQLSLNTALASIEANQSIRIASYNANSGQWETSALVDNEIPSTGWASEIEQASFKELVTAGYFTLEDIKAIDRYSIYEESELLEMKVPYTSQEFGHVVHWTMYVDTSKIAGVAKENVIVTASAIDRGSPYYNNGQIGYNSNPKKVTSNGQTGGNDGISAWTSMYTMDVVPYITGVQTQLSIKKASNPSIYNRTARGHYPVKDDEEVVIYGFNLQGAKYGNITLESVMPDTFNISDSNVQDALEYYGYNNGKQYVSLSISNIEKSGPFELSVNGVSSLNNKNTTDACGSYEATLDQSNYAKYAYNRQPNDYNNNLLDDDVIFDIWEFKDIVEAKDSSYCVEPIMRINPVDDRIGFAYANGPAYFSMSNGTNSSYTWWQRNYAKNIGTGFVYDENGNSHGITIGLDTNPNSGHGGRMTYMTSYWGPGDTGSQEGNYNGTNTIRLESIGVPANNNVIGLTSTVFMEERFPSLSLATTMHNGVPTVYYAYYDDLHQAIRFRYGSMIEEEPVEIASLTEGGRLNLNASNTNFQNKEIYLLNESGNKIGSASTGTQQGNRWNGYYYTLSNIVMDEGYEVGDVTAVQFYNKRNFDQFVDQVGYDGGQVGSNALFDASPNNYSIVVDSSTTAKPGYYVDIDALNGTSSNAEDVVVLTWYDATNDALMYSYKKNPCNDNDGYANSTEDGYWSPPIEIMKEAGEYCKIKVDAGGGVHIAAYNISGGDLIYAHISNYANKEFDIARVDTCDDTGEHITLDIAKSSNGKWIPYIGYYMGSAKKNKIAYLINDEKESIDYSDINGSQSDKFTQKWEVSIIPTTSVIREDHVNVGVWKDTDGNLKTSIKTAANTGDVNNGDCWGNGSTNPVLGYATRVGTIGHIETAQMK